MPAVAHWMHDSLPNEKFDPHFYGQKLVTTYFDTPSFNLRKARVAKTRYITIRVRCYEDKEGNEAYALSAKTEDQKFRVVINSMIADWLTRGEGDFITAVTANKIMPADLLARLIEIKDDQVVVPVVNVFSHRYAIEDDTDRFTLDTAICSDLGRDIPYAVLEYKSTQKEAEPPKALQAINLHPIKLSKFLWSTQR